MQSDTREQKQKIVVVEMFRFSVTFFCTSKVVFGSEKKNYLSLMLWTAGKLPWLNLFNLFAKRFFNVNLHENIYCFGVFNLHKGIGAELLLRSFFLDKIYWITFYMGWNSRQFIFLNHGIMYKTWLSHVLDVIYKIKQWKQKLWPMIILIANTTKLYYRS